MSTTQSNSKDTSTTGGTTALTFEKRSPSEYQKPTVGDAAAESSAKLSLISLLRRRMNAEGFNTAEATASEPSMRTTSTVEQHWAETADCKEMLRKAILAEATLSEDQDGSDEDFVNTLEEGELRNRKSWGVKTGVAKRAQ